MYRKTAVAGSSMTIQPALFGMWRPPAPAPIVAAVGRGETEEYQEGRRGHHEDGPHQRAVELSFSHPTIPSCTPTRLTGYVLDAVREQSDEDGVAVQAMVDLRREMEQLVAGITRDRYVGPGAGFPRLLGLVEEGRTT